MDLFDVPEERPLQPNPKPKPKVEKPVEDFSSPKPEPRVKKPVYPFYLDEVEQPPK